MAQRSSGLIPPAGHSTQWPLGEKYLFKPHPRPQTPSTAREHTTLLQGEHAVAPAAQEVPEGQVWQAVRANS